MASSADTSHRPERVPTVELLLDLRAGAVILGRPPRQRDMTNFGDYHGRTYHRRFDSWQAALEAAGIDPETGDLVEPLEAFLERTRGYDE